MSFPISDTVPKEETQAASFIEHFATFDGRGTVIAILDTGVCPGAVGLSVTTTGQPKLIELIDCTGSGDVEMHTEVEAEVDTVTGTRTLTGLTGRRLTLPATWPIPPSNKYRIGWKDSSPLFPTDLVRAQANKRRLRFDKEHHKLLSSATLSIPPAIVSTPSSTSSDAADTVDALKDLAANWSDPGVVWDVVALHDGVKWRAAIDINESGDFEGAKLLATYSDELEYHSFGDDTRLNYSLNFYDDGNLLSIVTLSGTHGTHVAAIAAANHPTDPRQNGVAPGAQIISLKIGDGRLGSQETPQSLVRAGIELARLKPDVANISYGEPGATYNFGKCIEIFQEEAVRKAGVIIVSAAGNAGPVLSSIGHPSGNSGILTVGAYLTEKMPGALYALLDDVPERPFSFTSVGPTLDGAVGVDVFAPGAAITSVPEYTKHSVQLYNGTSMACPNAAGSVSLLVSGLKQSQIRYNPYRVHAAIRNTAKQFGDPFKIGFLQVEAAWTHLAIPSLRHNLDVLYDVKVGGINHGRGLYLRSESETSTEQRQSVKITPLFTNPDDAETTVQMLEFEAQVSLECTVPWIKAPEFVLIASVGREFLFNVDPTGLAPGLHVGDILGYDTNQKNIGPLFRVPVTVCKTDLAADSALRRFGDLEFNSGEIVRKYVAVPDGANFARVETDEFKWTKTFPVTPNFTGELVMCQYCTSLGKTIVSVELEFHGLQVSAGSDVEGSLGTRASGDLIFLNSGNAALAHCDIHSRLRRESISVIAASLDKVQKSLRPIEAGTVSPLKSRDVLPDGRQLYELVLNYSLKVSEEGNVLPFYPRTGGTFYDNFFESVWIFVFDSQKALKSFHDAKIRPISLKEGTYTIKMQIVSCNVQILDKLKNTPILVNFDVKSVTLTSYKTLGGLISDTDKFSATTLLKGESTPFWLSGVEGSALPKFAAPGDLLLGSLKVTDALTVHKVAYLVPSESAKEKEKPVSSSIPETAAPSADAQSAAASGKDELADAIRDLQITHLKKLSDSPSKRDVLLTKLEMEHGKFLPYLVARLEIHGADFEKSKIEEDAALVEKAAAAILEVADRDAVAIYLGLKNDAASGSEASKKKAKEFDVRKDAIVLALLWNARVAKHRLAVIGSETAEVASKAFDESLVSLAQWLGTSDGKYVSLWVWWLKNKNENGTALKAIGKYLGDGKNVASGDVEKTKIWEELVGYKKAILEKLGWKIWVDYEAKWAFKKAPPSYVLF
ncbi:tripeptidyl-peptidase II Tpp2 [Physocladia obscura]|uniref:tripeptidyl-peptidase II n=1 Tax=Physocladia obscura TaxID=109957 RepID=A0AAD5TA21_9FUNG|nr:tripeptidyl-peptidase II Tpp2 [Physocladia obscura]